MGKLALHFVEVVGEKAHFVVRVPVHSLAVAAAAGLDDRLCQPHQRPDDDDTIGNQGRQEDDGDREDEDEHEGDVARPDGRQQSTVVDLDFQHADMFETVRRHVVDLGGEATGLDRLLGANGRDADGNRAGAVAHMHGFDLVARCNCGGNLLCTVDVEIPERLAESLGIRGNRQVNSIQSLLQRALRGEIVEQSEQRCDEDQQRRAYDQEEPSFHRVSAHWALRSKCGAYFARLTVLHATLNST